MISRRSSAFLAFCLAISVAPGSDVGAVPPSQRNVAPELAAQQPVLARYCYGCHNSRTKSEIWSLRAARSRASPTRRRFGRR